MSQLKVNSIVPAGGLPSGSNGGIIQVKQTVKTDVSSFSSSNTNTFVDLSGLSVAITPSSNSNKILILFTVSTGTNQGTINIRLVRGSTNIVIGDSSSSRLSTTISRRSQSSPYSLEVTPMSYTFLDSPATTSETTYKLQGTLGSSYNSTFYINRSQSDTDADYGSRVTSTITAMEVST